MYKHVAPSGFNFACICHRGVKLCGLQFDMSYSGTYLRYLAVFVWVQIVWCSCDCTILHTYILETWVHIGSTPIWETLTMVNGCSSHMASYYIETLRGVKAAMKELKQLSTQARVVSHSQATTSYLLVSHSGLSTALSLCYVQEWASPTCAKWGDLGGCMGQKRHGNRISWKQPRSDPTGASCDYVLKVLYILQNTLSKMYPQWTSHSVVNPIANHPQNHWLVVKPTWKMWVRHLGWLFPI